jgi:hypothetical protein
VLHLDGPGAKGTIGSSGKLVGRADLTPPASLMRGMIEQKVGAALKDAAGWAFFERRATPPGRLGVGATAALQSSPSFRTQVGLALAVVQTAASRMAAAAAPGDWARIRPGRSSDYHGRSWKAASLGLRRPAGETFWCSTVSRRAGALAVLDWAAATAQRSSWRPMASAVRRLWPTARRSSRARAEVRRPRRRARALGRCPAPAPPASAARAARAVVCCDSPPSSRRAVAPARRADPRRA